MSVDGSREEQYLLEHLNMMTTHFIICAPAAGGYPLMLKILHSVDEYNCFDLRIFRHDFYFGGRVAAFLSKESDAAGGLTLHSISNVCVIKRSSAAVKLSLLHLRICSRKPLPGGCCQVYEEMWDVREYKDY